MSLEGKDEGLLRAYLLGAMSEAEQQAFEERLVDDEELVELLHCEEDELVDDYLSGDLSKDERSRFVKYFMTTPERRKKLKFAQVLGRYKRDPDPTPDPIPNPDSGSVLDPNTRLFPKPRRKLWRMSIPAVRWAVATVIVLAVGIGSWQAYRRLKPPKVSKGMIALKQAYPNVRPTESRITDWDYAPPPPATRGPGRVSFNYQALDRAKALIQVEANENPSAESYHDLGRLYLAEQEFDKAIEQFEKALELDPKNAPIQGDLGLACFEKSKLDRSNGKSASAIASLDRSLEQLNQAIELNSSLMPPLFNKALVHTEMNLPEQAEQDWRLYLEKDSSSDWANEARQHLKKLEEENTRKSRTRDENYQEFLRAFSSGKEDEAWDVIVNTRDAASEMIWERLIDEHLEVSNKSRDDGHRTNQLNALSLIGRLESERTGDQFIAELAAYYKSPLWKLGRVTEARRLMKIGRRFIVEGRPRDAIKPFEKSQKAFSVIGDRWEADFATQWMAYSYLQASITKPAVSALELLLRPLELKKHRWMLMRTLYVLSGAEYNLGEYTKSIEHNVRSLKLARQLGDTIGIFNVLSILVEQYRYIGNYEESLNCIESTLSLLNSGILNPNQIAQHYTIISSALISSDLNASAADYQREALRRALENGRPRLISIAYTRLAQIYGRVGRHSEAIENALLSYEAARSIPDESVRNTMMALASVAIGDLHREIKEYDKSLDRYNDALKLYSNLDFNYGVLEVHRNMLLCYLALGEDEATREELRATLDLIEHRRSTILDEKNRNNFFDNAQSVYDIAIDFVFSKMNGPEKAFQYAEESRARTLLDEVVSTSVISESGDEHKKPLSSPVQPLTVNAILEEMPKDAQLIQFAVLKDKILMWILSSEGIRCRTSETSQQRLEETVRGYLQVLGGSGEIESDRSDDYARELFDYLIKPVEPLLDKNKTICIVPDKILNYLPFGALRSRETGRFIVQDYVSIISPSATLFVICSKDAARKKSNRAERLLSVGNPRFDREQFKELADLPSAATEATEVARLYRSPCLLTGDDARESRVRAEMQRADVIHLAVHSVVNERTPLNSKLLLTAERNRTTGDESIDGVLDSREVYDLKLARARVALLSACQTGVARYYRGEGMISFARPFLSKGVSLVVVSLWRVDTAATEILMSNLHRYRKGNPISTAKALSLAQREMMETGSDRYAHPRYWAPFVAIGGLTSF